MTEINTARLQVNASQVTATQDGSSGADGALGNSRDGSSLFGVSALDGSGFTGSALSGPDGIDATGAEGALTKPAADSRNTPNSPSQREEAVLAQYLNQLCAALMQEMTFRPGANAGPPEPELKETELDLTEPEEDLDAARLADSMAETDQTSNPNACAQNLDDAVPFEFPRERPAPSASLNIETPAPRLTDFWDAVAAQHAAPGASSPSNERSVFDAVAQVAATRLEATPQTLRPQTASTQETQRQSMDIIAAFESLFGIHEPDPAPQRPRELLQRNAERAVFAALTFAEGTALCTAGRRG